MRVSAVFAMGGHGQDGDYPFCGCYGQHPGFTGFYYGEHNDPRFDYYYYNGYNYGGYTYFGHDRRLGKL